jgi:hypothetical protein
MLLNLLKMHLKPTKNAFETGPYQDAFQTSALRWLKPKPESGLDWLIYSKFEHRLVGRHRLLRVRHLWGANY